MSKTYKVRYKITRPSLTVPFWMKDADIPSAYEEIQEAAYSLGGTHNFQITLDGLSIILDYTFDCENLRTKFFDMAYEIDKKYQKTYKKQYEVRNEHHEKFGLIEETIFFEETS